VSDSSIPPDLDDIELQPLPPLEGPPHLDSDPVADLEYAYGPPEHLIHYVMDLEDLVRWFALAYRRVLYVETIPGAPAQEVVEIGDPIWAAYDQFGNHLPAAEKLQLTWNRVMHPDGVPQESNPS
jgi:hypothetical protein